MGKHDFLSPKAIANRIKSKGLQKLRWYCQLCQKQCRDENGFKCHQTSESHMRQMQMFGQNPERYVDGYTEMFQEAFLEHLRQSHRYNRISAHVAYNELIADKQHIHMNSTKWATLTEFVQHLGKEGLCKVDHTPKGWFVHYIDKDPFEEMKVEARLKRDRAEESLHQRQEREVEEQMERAAKLSKVEDPLPESTDLLRTNPEEKVTFGVAKTAGKAVAGTSGRAAGEAEGKGKGPALAAFAEEEAAPKQRSAGPSGNASSKPAKNAGMGALEEIMKDEERKKQQKAFKDEKTKRTDNWIVEGIVVKVLSKELKEHGYYKKKGTIMKVTDRYLAQIKMADSGDVLRVDQDDLETVLPNIGNQVLVVNGAYRGELATLLSIDMDKFCGEVRIQGGYYRGREVSLAYEDICKVAST